MRNCWNDRDTTGTALVTGATGGVIGVTTASLLGKLENSAVVDLMILIAVVSLGSFATILARRDRNPSLVARVSEWALAGFCIGYGCGQLLILSTQPPVLFVGAAVIGGALAAGVRRYIRRNFYLDTTGLHE